jgi:hypothetical protein
MGQGLALGSGSGLVARIMFGFGRCSNDSNQTLYRVFGQCSFLKDKVSHYSPYGLKHHKPLHHSQKKNSRNIGFYILIEIRVNDTIVREDSKHVMPHRV